ncbi:MAG: 50S ribosomal protein L6 [bacterium]|nr:50S ribosomal protein L6 [bacterium]
MSRIGKKPIAIPPGVEVKVQGNAVEVKGPRGKMKREFPAEFPVTVAGGKVDIKRSSEERQARASHGLIRALINNMVTGVSTGFERRLQVMGVGYRASVEGKALKFLVGYSHPVEYKLPEGIEAKVEKNTLVILTGMDRQVLGQTAAEIRAIRPPSAYKELGIRYFEEHIKLKPGKTGATGAAGGGAPAH